MADCEVEANSRQCEAAVKRGKNARRTIRVFAAVRLIITVIATNLVLLKPDSKKTWSLRDDALQAKIDQRNIVGILKEKIVYEDARRFIEDARLDQMWDLHRSLFLVAINILIMSLLWAGAFANKKKCLHIYAILEASQVQIAFNISIHGSPLLNPSRDNLMTCISIGIALLAYCGLFVPLVLHRYYKYLDEKDKKRERLIYGGVAGNTKPLLSNE